jgi:hypothetical protein
LIVVPGVSAPLAVAPVIERHPVTASSDMDKETADILRAVSLERITYMSDGLRIHGYLATPKGPRPFRAVISNRGRNFNLSVWTDVAACESLAPSRCGDTLPSPASTAEQVAAKATVHDICHQ